MLTKALKYLNKDLLTTLKLSSKISERKSHKAAMSGERMITMSEAEDILNKILADHLFQINLN